MRNSFVIIKPRASGLEFAKALKKERLLLRFRVTAEIQSYCRIYYMGVNVVVAKLRVLFCTKLAFMTYHPYTLFIF